MEEPEEFDLALIFCMPITTPMEKPGSEPGLCENCKKTVVWITPMKKELRENRKNSMFVCAACAIKLTQGSVAPDELINLEDFPRGKFFDKK